mgnify:CR=1 FL=1
MSIYIGKQILSKVVSTGAGTGGTGGTGSTDEAVGTDETGDDTGGVAGDAGDDTGDDTGVTSSETDRRNDIRSSVQDLKKMYDPDAPGQEQAKFQAMVEDRGGISLSPKVYGDVSPYTNLPTAVGDKVFRSFAERRLTGDFGDTTPFAIPQTVGRGQIFEPKPSAKVPTIQAAKERLEGLIADTDFDAVERDAKAYQAAIEAFNPDEVKDIGDATASMAQARREQAMPSRVQVSKRGLTQFELSRLRQAKDEGALSVWNEDDETIILDPKELSAERARLRREAAPFLESYERTKGYKAILDNMYARLKRYEPDPETTEGE